MNRRAILKAGLGAGALFLPVPFAWVWAQQADGAVRLLRAPKVALVIGNGRYKDAPELKNAPNDAKAIGAVLKESGFEVTLKLDTGREEMLEAIRAYVHLMEKKQHVGLFYFAGHGVQLAWRNYLLPVDAVIDKIEDVAKQSVDIARLLDGLTKASNPMNVIILDACRENPFGKDFRVEQKGLSQMDAPNLTFLAYATSPGNVASDGDGVNGLYTENLLREIKVPEAKIEDVFKRVRLNVRRKSNGAQVPWESTSLEDDFWFHPPKEIKNRSDNEKEKAFKEELELWQKIQAAAGKKTSGMQPVLVAAAGNAWPGSWQMAQAGGAASNELIAMLEDYLRRYPNGNFSEHAQLELDRALASRGEKKIEIVNAAANPYTKGSARADIAYKVGDTYVLRFSDIYTKVAQPDQTGTIAQITDSEVVWSQGLITDLLGNPVRLRDGRRFTPSQIAPAEFAVGKHWTTRFIVTAPSGGDFRTEFDMKIAARESITVPAGTFNAFRVEASGLSVGAVVVTLQSKTWFAPEQVRVPIAGETFRRVRNRGSENVIESSRRELVSFKQG